MIINKEMTSKTLKNAFIVAFIVSVVWLVFADMVLNNNTIIIFGSAIAFVLYIYNFHKNGAPERLREQFADSLYYLGFLMTISSLIYSLYYMGGSDGGQEAGTILKKFGIALITTLIGLFLRIYYSHFANPVETDTLEAHESLHQKTISFTHELKMSHDAVVKLNEKVLKNLSGIEENFNEQINKVATLACDKLELMASQNNTQLMNQISSFSAGIDNLLKEMSILSAKISSVNFPENVFEENLIPSLRTVSKEMNIIESSVTSAGQSFSKMADVNKDFKREIVGTMEMVQEFRDITVKNTETAKAFGKMLTNMSGLTHDAQELSNNSIVLTEGMKKQVSLISQELEQVRQLRIKLFDEVEKASKATMSMTDTLVESGNYIADNLRNR